jgi:hypothetical protein
MLGISINNPSVPAAKALLSPGRHRAGLNTLPIAVLEEGDDRAFTSTHIEKGG